MKGTKNPINLIKTAKFRKEQKKDSFPYYGLEAYMGAFGSGKTLSVVKKVLEITEKYPKATIITNFEIKQKIKNPYYEFTGEKELMGLLNKLLDENNENGYVILLDEMHVLLAQLFKSDNQDFLTYISQLRKFGILIIGTCQLYNKCPKLIRDYLRLSGQIIICSKPLPGITINQFVNMETCEETSNLKLNYDIERWEWYFHTIELYQSYDTKKVISQIKKLIEKEK